MSEKIPFFIGIFLWAALSALAAIVGLLFVDTPMSSLEIAISVLFYLVASPFVSWLLFPVSLIPGYFLWIGTRDVPKERLFPTTLRYFLPTYIAMLVIIPLCDYSCRLISQHLEEREAEAIYAHNEAMWDLREARQTTLEEFFGDIDTFAECNSSVNVWVSSLWINETGHEPISDSSFIAGASCLMKNRDGSVLRDTEGLPQSTVRLYFVMFEGSMLRSVYEAIPSTKEDAQANVSGEKNQIKYLKQGSRVYSQ